MNIWISASSYSMPQRAAVALWDGGDVHAAERLPSAVWRQAAAGPQTHSRHSDVAQQHAWQVWLGQPAVQQHSGPTQHLQCDIGMWLVMLHL